MGYGSTLSTFPTKAVLEGSHPNGVKRLHSDIVFLMGHGNGQTLEVADGIGITANQASQTSGYVKTGAYYWNNTRLVVLVGCETSQQNTGYSFGNLAKDICDRSGGATTTVGWEAKPHVFDTPIWANRFNEKLATGATVYDACVYADNYLYWNNNVRSWHVYGNYNRSLTLSKGLSSEFEESNVSHINEEVFFSGEERDLYVITSLLEKKYQNFNMKEFDTYIHKQNDAYEDFSIFFEHKIKDYYTHQGYIIYVKDGKVDRIVDNMDKNSLTQRSNNLTKIENVEVTDEMISKMKLETMDEINLSVESKYINSIKVVEQYYKKFINAQTNETSIVIFTEYTTNGKTSVVTSHTFDI